MTLAYDLQKKTVLGSYHLNQVFLKFDVSYHVLYNIIPVKTINNGKTQVTIFNKKTDKSVASFDREKSL